MEILHFSHYHPLILCEEKNDDGNEVFCSACSQMITGSAYGCVKCSFFLHNRCAELPGEIIHPMDPAHPLILLARAPYNYDGVICGVCENIIASGFTYHCSLCDFAIDIGCAMIELSDTHERNKHPFGRRIGHEHPLILIEEKNDDSEEIDCDRCRQNISGSAYSCRNCPFFLHKLCATLPLEMKHPVHPDQLTIQERSDSVCEVCKQNVHGCAYHCSNSNFVVDISCAVRSQSVDHTNHDHPLNPMLSPALFDCHACGTKHAGLSYVCNTCKFWIHEDCFLLPTTVKHSGHHDHFLNLDSFPYESSKIGYTCGICGDDMNKNCWIYRCGPCKYFVHVHCSAKTREGKIVFKREELDVGNLIRLPLANESSDLIDQFVSQFSKGANERKERFDRFFPFIHEHPLTSSKSELSTLNEQKINAKVCNACAEPISASSFYSCTQCSNFFIHEWCAYLPKDLKHECHRHPLSLKIPSPEKSRSFHCKCCKSSCNGFSFECFECGDYCLDVKCASLPIYIMHEAHNDHPLLLRNNRSTKACAACAEDVKEFSFGCRICDFDLHHKCALLPRTFTHRYDEHPFILTYAAIEDGPDEYYCEFCEEEMDPKRWFYHCVDCDQSACANCICKEIKMVY